jgi:hypothetical protein
MSYAKGENTPARKRRRLPFRVVIEEREEPFLAADRAELEAECRRITNGEEFLYSMKRSGDCYEHVVRFAAEHQAATLADWLRLASARSVAPTSGQSGVWHRCGSPRPAPTGGSSLRGDGRCAKLEPDGTVLFEGLILDGWTTV